MLEAVSNTSPLIYLHRIGGLDWLPLLFSSLWVPTAVVAEIREGHRLGHEVPDPSAYPWIQVVEPKAPPVEWLALDLGPGELAAMALGLENPQRAILLDDRLARRTAQAAGLNVWGTLRILLEAKQQGWILRVSSYVDLLRDKGMWVSGEVRMRILTLAGEN